MPAQSGDPVSSALQVSLVNSNSKKEASDISVLLSYSAKQVLLSDIKYEEYKYDSTSFLSGLKSKYLIISEKDNSENTNDIESVNCNKLLTNKGNSVSGSERSNGLDKNESKVSKPKLPLPERVLWPPEKIVLGWKGQTPVGGGFINLGRSCYINSTLQALFHIPGFVNWLIMENSHICPTKPPFLSGECLICAMSQTLKNSQESTGKAIKPYLIYSRLRSICKQLNPGEQEDAHEFLRHLVDSLDRTYLLPYKGLKLDHLSKETTPLGQIFGGYLRNEVVCQVCEHISTTFQYFQDMPLDIRNSSHIDGAFESFFSKELLSKQEGYMCENCKREVPFTKKFSLEKAPRVLCVQLKRFDAVSGKNNKSVGLSPKLNLNKFRAFKNGENFDSYELMAIVNHLGMSTNCGHYTALAMASDNKYYLFDDQRVESLHDMTHYSSDAYILLYEQKPTHNLPNGIKPELSISKLNSNNNIRNNHLVLINSNKSLKDKMFGKTEVKTFRFLNNPIRMGIEEKKIKIEEVEEKLEVAEEVKVKEEVVKEPLVNGAHDNDFSKSLVPYNESSSSSESDGSRGESRCTSPVGMCNGKETKSEVKNPVVCSSNSSDKPGDNRLDSSDGRQSDCRTPDARPADNRMAGRPAEVRIISIRPLDSPSKSDYRPLTNGHMSPAKSKFNNHSNGNRGNGRNSWPDRGSWKVTTQSDNSNSASPNKNLSKNSWQIKSENVERTDSKSQLMSMNHRGYGKHISTWSGEKSEMDKEVTREKLINHRLSVSFEDNYDSPAKKMKKYHNGGGGFDSVNRFQELQKRKNWHYGKGGREFGHYERQRPATDGYQRNRQWHHHHL